jgi:hypothetical protein
VDLPPECSPHDLKTIGRSIRSLGSYDLRNIVDLMRYLLPVSLVPSRFRRTALHFGSGAPTEVICSSHLGQLFQSVGFPIAPTVELPHGFDAPRARGRSPLVLTTTTTTPASSASAIFAITPRDLTCRRTSRS